MAEDNMEQHGIEQFTDEDVDGWIAADEEEEATEEVAAPSLEDKYVQTQVRIVRQSVDFTLHTLKQNLNDRNYINLSPPFQRRHRWDSKKRSQLIESFLMNIPVPPIFLYENDYNQYEVMDGRQRLEAVHDYLNNEFPLKGMAYWKELVGLRFNELPVLIRNGLLRRTLSATVLLKETEQPPDLNDDIRMILFRRLNTGGVQLNPQELRNALYTGPFNDMIADTARSDVFCEVWRIPKKTARETEEPPQQLRENTLFKTMADCELVLRFFAIREALDQDVGGSLRRLMDLCMARHAGDDQDSVRRLQQEYLALLKQLVEAFDSRPFCLPARTETIRPKTSRPLYDSLMVAASRLQGVDLTPNKTAIQSCLGKALSNPADYDVLVGRANTMDAIKERVEMASSILTAGAH